MTDRIPSAPSRTGAACVYITRGKDKRIITTWGTLHAARAQVDAALNGEKFKWLADDAIVTPTGVKIQCHRLEEIMELDPDGLQSQEQRAVDRFLSDNPDAAAPLSKRERRKAAAAAAAKAATPTPDPSPSSSAPNAYPVAVAAQMLGIEPRQLRRRIRAANWQKGINKTGWVIYEDDIPALRKIIKEK